MEFTVLNVISLQVSDSGYCQSQNALASGLAVIILVETLGRGEIGGVIQFTVAIKLELTPPPR